MDLREAAAIAALGGGKAGVRGTDGQDGYTPVKGTDYFTEADKAELVQDVIDALPTFNGEVE